jgi:endonuclease-3
MPPKINWPEAIKPLIKKYKGKKHPLEYKNTITISDGGFVCTDSDRNINQLAPKLLKLS